MPGSALASAFEEQHKIQLCLLNELQVHRSRKWRQKGWDLPANHHEWASSLQQRHLDCHRKNCSSPGMEASRAVELAWSGALFPPCFPAHPPDGVREQPGSTACFKLQLVVMVLKKGVTREKSHSTPTVSRLS